MDACSITSDVARQTPQTPREAPYGPAFIGGTLRSPWSQPIAFNQDVPEQDAFIVCAKHVHQPTSDVRRVELRSLERDQMLDITLVLAAKKKKLEKH
jgi:hypothetical protein